jgi:3-hydroxyacyl-[acyl-carrier-protein] dehydratase
MPSLGYAAPLLAIDDVVRLERDHAVTRKVIAGNEPYLDGHYPDYPVYPGVFIIEAVHQTVLRYAERHFGKASLLEVRSSRFLSALRPGDVLESECTFKLQEDGGKLQVSATCRHGDVTVAMIKSTYAVGLDAESSGRAPRAITQENARKLEATSPRSSGSSGSSYGHAELKTLMPHRYPMLLVDAVLALEPWVSVVGIKNITGTESSFARLNDSVGADGYAYPCSLIIESFGQTGGVLINAKRKHDAAPADVVMLFAGLSNFRFFAGVFPGDTMEHRVRLEKDLTDFAVLSGEVRVRGQLVAEAESIIVAYRPASGIATATRRQTR